MKTAVFALSLFATPALAEAPNVLTDIPPVQSLATMVLGEAPAVLVDRGADPHHFQLRPSQARGLAQSDIVFWVGQEFTPWLSRALDGNGDLTSVELLDALGDEAHAFGGDGGHGHNDDGHDDHDSHDHDGLDPHAWLSPDNASAWVDIIAHTLTEADPEGATTYATNAAQAKAEIARIRAEVTAILAPARDVPLMVFHDAYGYFADSFDLNIVGSITLGDAAKPSAARLTDIRDHIREDGVVCIFPEANHDPAYIATVIEGSGAKVGGALDPSGTSLTAGAGLYEALLKGMAQTIADCVAG